MAEKKAKQRSYNKWSILFTVLIMTFMVTLDSSIVNVALPVMEKQLHVGMGDVQWVAAIYLVATCACILLFGRMGDLWGKVRIFQIGVLLFTLGSLLCSLAASLAVLIVARAVQGLGAAAALANNQGIITESFPQQERGRALGMISTFVALGTMAGPTLGGAILTVLPWEYIFLINIPVGVLSFLIGLRTLPRGRPVAEKAGRKSLDVPGSALMMLSIVLIFCAVTLLQSGVQPYMLLMLGVGLAMLLLFLWVERRARQPLVPLGVFRNRQFSLNLLTMLCSFVAIGATNILLPFYLQDARQFPASMAGLLLTVMPLVTAAVGPVSGALSDRIGCELPTMVGLLINALGLLLMSTLLLGTPLPVLVVFLAVMSLGGSMFQSPNNSLVMGSAPKDSLGFVGSLAGLTRSLGMTVGVTAGTTLLYNRMSAKVGYQVNHYVQGRDDAFLYGMQCVFLFLMAVVLVGAVLTIARFVRKRRREKQSYA